MAKVPQSHIDIIRKQTFAHFATMMPDGTPHVSPVWVDEQDGYVLINSAVGRVKDQNVVANPSVAVSMTDPDNPYRMLAIRGRVVERKLEGADEHIDKMAKKYLGKDKYPFRQPGEQRVLYRIEAVKVSTYG